jgi:hypothetical protein
MLACLPCWAVRTLKSQVKKLRVPQMDRLKGAGALTESAYQELRSRRGVDRWAFFTPGGEEVSTRSAIQQTLEQCGALYVFEGGNFMWPGVRVGHNLTLEVCACTRRAACPRPTRHRYLSICYSSWPMGQCVAKTPRLGGAGGGGVGGAYSCRGAKQTARELCC